MPDHEVVLGGTPHSELGISRAELLTSCAHPSRNRALLMTTYAAGLRVSETVSLKVTDIDSNRMTIRVEQAKGVKDSYPVLSVSLLEELRSYWKLYKPPTWLFHSTHDPNLPVGYLPSGLHSSTMR